MAASLELLNFFVELKQMVLKFLFLISALRQAPKPVDSRVKIILDVKTPDSGAADSFNFKNLNFINSSTEIKFVICSENDFEWAENFNRQYELSAKCSVLYSPSYNVISEKWLAEKILQSHSPVRMQLQLHKYIWSPELRGV